MRTLTFKPAPPFRALRAVRGLLALCLAAPAWLGAAPMAATGQTGGGLEALNEAMVGVRAEISKEANTSRFLGDLRHGNGVVIDDAGTILTIGYLVVEAQSVSVLTHEGKEHPARVVAYDAHSGIGVLRAMQPLGVRPAVLGDSAAVKEGDPMLVLTRHPQAPFSPARVVGRRTFVGYWEYMLENAIYTAPPVEHYAGAGLFDSNFRLVGIGSLFLESAGTVREDSPGNMFVPIGAFTSVREALMRTGRPPGPARPWMGLSLTEQHGRLMVLRVSSKGPAAKAGISVGDLLLAIDGQKVARMDELFRALWTRGQAGRRVRLTLLQGNELKEVTLVTGNRYDHYINLPKGE